MEHKSYFYKLYVKRLILRIIVLLIMLGIFIISPNSYKIVKGFHFFKNLSLLHIIWLMWMFDMITQLLKVPKYWPIGSQKYMEYAYKKPLLIVDKENPKRIIKEMTKDSISVAISWILLVIIIGILYLTKIIPYQIVIIISTIFYVCDVICIIGWCPFRTFYMHNKCCTTCRIFNWDHAMMFSPLIFIPGIFTYSLFFTSIIVVIIWEISCYKHPERFIEKTNNSLKCLNCKDKLCGKRIKEESYNQSKI